MKKYTKGALIGIIVGIFNCLSLIFVKDIEITVYISTFITWIVIGIFTNIVKIDLNSIIKGIIVALLVSLPSLVYTVASSIFGAIWTLATTLISGAILGYFIEK